MGDFEKALAEAIALDDATDLREADLLSQAEFDALLSKLPKGVAAGVKVIDDHLEVIGVRKEHSYYIVDAKIPSGGFRMRPRHFQALAKAPNLQWVHYYPGKIKAKVG